MDTTQKWIAEILAAGLGAGMLEPSDVLRHATAEVLAHHLPNDVKARLLASSLRSGRMTPELVLESVGVETLASHAPPQVLWAIVSEAAARALGGAAAARSGATSGGQTTPVPAPASPTGGGTESAASGGGWPGGTVAGAVSVRASQTPAVEIFSSDMLSEPQAGGDAGPQAGGDAGPQAAGDAGEREEMTHVGGAPRPGTAGPAPEASTQAFGDELGDFEVAPGFDAGAASEAAVDEDVEFAAEGPVGEVSEGEPGLPPLPEDWGTPPEVAEPAAEGDYYEVLDNPPAAAAVSEPDLLSVTEALEDDSEPAGEATDAGQRGGARQGRRGRGR